MIPIIDVRHKHAPQQLINAYETVGVAWFKGLDICHSGAVEAIEQAAKSFFTELSPAEKMQYRMPSGGVERGYEPLGSEKLDPDLAVPGYSDRHEAFTLNCEVPLTAWPLAIETVGFQSEFEAFKQHCFAASQTILQLLERALTLPEHFFTSRHRDGSGCNLRLLHYPAGDCVNGTGLRLSEHTDYDVISLVWLLDDHGGLEFQRPDGH